MPRGDRTGPMGQGPTTGRALGYCAGFDTPGFAKGGGLGMGRGYRMGRGYGWGRGFGPGRRFGNFNQAYPQVYPWVPEPSKEDEIRMLKAQAEELSRSQKDIEKRLKDLEKTDE